MEQRKAQRFNLKLPFELIRDGTSSKSSGETRNLSSSGVLFTSSAPLEVGQSIEYLITLPKSSSGHPEVQLRCIGKVVRGEPESSFAVTMERYEFVRT